jgi:hypothetical protein
MGVMSSNSACCRVRRSALAASEQPTLFQVETLPLGERCAGSLTSDIYSAAFRATGFRGAWQRRLSGTTMSGTSISHSNITVMAVNYRLRILWRFRVDRGIARIGG